MRRGVRRVIPAVFVAFVLLAGVVVVVAAEGYRSTKVDLNDAGVWITRATTPSPGQAATASIGRLNMEVTQVDTKIDTGDAPDVLQSGSIVFIKANNSVTTVDPVDPSRAKASASVPAGADLGLGGGTLALLDRGSPSSLHIADAVHFQAGGFESKPAARFDKAARMAVGTDGIVHVVEGQHVRTYLPDGSQASDHTIDLPSGDQLTITAAGPRSVVLDATARRLVIVGGKALDIASYGTNPVLQQPSDDGAVVAFATDSNLVNVSTGGGTPTHAFASAAAGPIEPVRLHGCSYGAWQLPGIEARACDAQSPDSVRFGGGHKLRFRVNHGRVTLNDTDSGEALIVDGKPPRPVDGAWQDALTVRPEQQAQNPDQGQQRTSTDNSPNHDLKAEPINVSARAGRPRSIAALASAPGALYVTKVTQPSAGSAAVGLNGQSIEFDPGDTGAKVRTFSYTVSDGTRDATGTVTVTIVGTGDVNHKPVTVDDPITVAPGGTAVVNVLANDDDPDGDGLMLTRAVTTDGTLDAPQFQPNGVVSVRAGQSLGRHVVTYTVADDFGAEATGQLIVTVAAQSKVVARDDFALGQVGEQISVRPLANDLSPSGPLRIASITPEGANAGSLQVRDRSDSEVRFVASAPGLYTAKYQSVDDVTGSSGEASIRLVVSAGSGHRPTAATDRATVTTDVPVVIPVLANDSDPDGDVLAVTGVDPGSRELAQDARDPGRGPQAAVPSGDGAHGDPVRPTRRLPVRRDRRNHRTGDGDGGAPRREGHPGPPADRIGRLPRPSSGSRRSGAGARQRHRPRRRPAHHRPADRGRQHRVDQ